ncbi:unnamed protein product [Amoebophrya sp. A120]|nr:unnamed protein product [Amoebophrya sp. A120]|eukprot:GSA120T00022566001.1
MAVQQTMPTAPIPRRRIHGKQDDVCCASCDQWTALPSTEMRDVSTNSILRINFAYWDRHCCTCGPHPGVTEQDQHCPEEVIQAAIVNCGGNKVVELKEEVKKSEDSSSGDSTCSSDTEDEDHHDVEVVLSSSGRVVDIREELIAI